MDHHPAGTLLNPGIYYVAIGYKPAHSVSIFNIIHGLAKKKNEKKGCAIKFSALSDDGTSVESHRV